jgi:hypothetical protein
MSDRKTQPHHPNGDMDMIRELFHRMEQPGATLESVVAEINAERSRRFAKIFKARRLRPAAPTTTGKFLWAIADSNRNQLAARASRVIKLGWLDQGKGFPGGLPPAGFDRPTRQHHHRENDDMKTLRELFSRMDHPDAILSDVVAKMNAEGWLIRAKPITVVQAFRILTNPIYVSGKFVTRWNGTAYQSWTEPLTDPIAPAVFARIQKALRARTRHKRR